MSIAEYKDKFQRLFEEMEKEHGVCAGVNISRSSEFFYTVPFKMSNIIVDVKF